MERQSTSKLFRTVIAVLAFFALCMSALLFAACDKGTSAHTHTYSETAITTSAATCGAPGSVTYECTVCHERYSVVVSLATGAHDFDSNGRCTVCGLSEDEAGLTVQALRSTLQVELNDLSSRLALLEQLKDVQDTLGGRIANYSEKVQQLQEALTESQAALGQNINSANGGIDQLARNFDALYAGIFGEPLSTAAEGFTRPTALNALLNYIAQGLENVLGSGKDNDLTDEELASLQDVYNGVTEFQTSLDEFGTTLEGINTTITTSIKSVTDILGTFTTPDTTVASMLEAILKAVQGGEETAPHAHTVHSFILQPVEGRGASCTTPGLYQYVCAIDGCTVTAGEPISLPALGHTIDKWSTEADNTGDEVHYYAATCIAPERVQAHCSVCDAWVDEWKEVGAPTYEHNYQLEKEVEANCQHVGQRTWHCATCGGAYVETTSSVSESHNYYVELAEDGSLTGTGLTAERKLEICKEYFGEDERTAFTEQEMYEALADYLNIVSETAATCTAPGLIVVACADCGVRYAYSYGEPHGHTWHAVTEGDYSSLLDLCTLGVIDGGAKLFHCDTCGHFIVSAKEVADLNKTDAAEHYTSNYIREGRRAIVYTNAETGTTEVVNAWKAVVKTVIENGAYEDAEGKSVNVRTEPKGHVFEEKPGYLYLVEGGDCTKAEIGFYVCKVCGTEEDVNPDVQDNTKLNVKIDPDEFRARLFPASGKKYAWYVNGKEEGATEWAPEEGYLMLKYGVEGHNDPKAVVQDGEPGSAGWDAHSYYVRHLGTWLGYPEAGADYNAETDAFKAWASTIKTKDGVMDETGTSNLYADVKAFIGHDYDENKLGEMSGVPEKANYDLYRYMLNTSGIYFGMNIAGWYRNNTSHAYVNDIATEDYRNCFADPILTALFHAWEEGSFAHLTATEWYTAAVTEPAPGTPAKWADITTKITDTLLWTAEDVKYTATDGKLVVGGVEYDVTKYIPAIERLAKEDDAHLTGLTLDKFDAEFLTNATQYGIINFCTNEKCPLHDTTETTTGFTASFHAGQDHVMGWYKFVERDGARDISDVERDENGRPVEYTMEMMQEMQEAYEAGEEGAIKALTESGTPTCWFVYRCANYDACHHGDANSEVHEWPDPNNDEHDALQPNCRHGAICVVCHEILSAPGKHRLITIDEAWLESAKSAESANHAYLALLNSDQIAWWIDPVDPTCTSVGKQIEICLGCLDGILEGESINWVNSGENPNYRITDLEKEPHDYTVTTIYVVRQEMVSGSVKSVTYVVTLDAENNIVSAKTQDGVDAPAGKFKLNQPLEGQIGCLDSYYYVDRCANDEAHEGDENEFVNGHIRVDNKPTADEWAAEEYDWTVWFTAAQLETLGYVGEDLTTGKPDAIPEFVPYYGTEEVAGENHSFGSEIAWTDGDGHYNVHAATNHTVAPLAGYWLTGRYVAPTLTNAAQIPYKCVDCGQEFTSLYTDKPDGYNLATKEQIEASDYKDLLEEDAREADKKPATDGTTALVEATGAQDLTEANYGLSADTTVKGPLKATQAETTFDLGGHTLKFENADATDKTPLLQAGTGITMTIKNGKIDAGAIEAAWVNSGATLIIEGVEITTSANVGVYSEGTANLIIRNSKIWNYSEANGATAIYTGTNSTTESSTVLIEGCELWTNNTNNGAIYIRCASDVTIKDTKIHARGYGVQFTGFTFDNKPYTGDCVINMNNVTIDFGGFNTATDGAKTWDTTKFSTDDCQGVVVGWNGSANLTVNIDAKSTCTLPTGSRTSVHDAHLAVYGLGAGNVTFVAPKAWRDSKYDTEAGTGGTITYTKLADENA